MKFSFSRLRVSPLVALLSFLGLLGALLIAGVIWFRRIYESHPATGSLDFEIAKTLLEIGVVSVAAALVSLMAKHYERSVENQQKDRDARNTDVRYRAELLKATATRITSSYNKAKKARRSLRALARNRSIEPTRIILANYDKFMADVNDAQLELEGIKRDVEADIESKGGAFPSGTIVAPNLKKMEEYLGHLNKEYEDVRSKCAPEADDIPLAVDKPLADFLGEVEDSQFEDEFSIPHSKVREAINADLLVLISKR